MYNGKYSGQYTDSRDFHSNTWKRYLNFERWRKRLLGTYTTFSAIHCRLEIASWLLTSLASTFVARMTMVSQMTNVKKMNFII